MQQGLPDSTPAPRQRAGETDAVIGEGLALVVDAVGERKRVLDLGCGVGNLAQALARRECDVVGFDIDPKAVEQARTFCVHAGVADLDAVSLDELLGDDRFDVIVLADVLQNLRKPLAVLDRARDLLREGGYVVALVPNAGHGAVRLALLDDGLETLEGEGSESVRGYTAKRFDELFLSAGYRLDSMQRTQRPIFETASGGLDRADFDPAIVAEVERTAEAETLQFVARAYPLSDDAKHRAIAKRFIGANTRLASIMARLEKRNREIGRLGHTVAEREGELREARSQLVAAEGEMQRARVALAELAEASRDGASLIARAAEFEARATAAETRYREVEARATALLERAHRAELDSARFGERLAVYGERPVAQPDPQVEARLTAALTESADLRAALEAERANLAERLAETKAEFGSTLATLRRNSEVTEYGYAQRVADLEIERDAQIALVEERRADVDRVAAQLAATLAETEAVRAETESARAEHQSRLHQLGTEIQRIHNALAQSQSHVVELDGRIASLTAQHEEAREARDAIHALHDEESAALAAARAEVEQARGMLATLTDERNSLKEHVATRLAEVGRMQGALGTMQRERDTHRAALDESRAQIGVLDERIASLTTKHEEACDARDAIHALHDEESAALDAARADVEQSREMLATLADERDSLKVHVDTTRAELDRVQDALGIMQRERDAHKTAFDESRVQTADLTTRYDGLLSVLADELGTARDNFITTAGERDGYKTALEAKRAELAAAHGNFATIERERNELKVALFASRDALDEARARAREFEDLFSIADAELSAATRESAGYFELLSLADSEIATSTERIASLEAGRRADAALAQKELRAFEERYEALEAARQEAERAAERDRAVVELERNAAVAELELTRVGLTDAGGKLVELETHAQALMQERDRLLVTQQERQKQIEDAIVTWKAQLEGSNGHRARLEIAIQESRKENGALRIRADENAKQAGEIERRFADHVRGAIDQTRAETERTALLIDTVQSSVFWKIKRWLSLRRAG